MLEDYFENNDEQDERISPLRKQELFEMWLEEYGAPEDISNAEKKVLYVEFEKQLYD